MLSQAGLPIEVENLFVKYGNLVAVAGVSFTVIPNTIFGLLGPNGAGKTSIIRVLTTLIKPSGGRVLLGGFDVARRPEAVRRVIGLVPQNGALYDDLTARENLRFFAEPYHLPSKVREENIERIARSIEIEDRLDDRVGTFSGGMKQKISVAAAIVHSPKILIMDEPTLGLDPKVRRSIWRLLDELKTRMTILLTTHYMDEAQQICDQVAIINRGQIIAQGNPAELNQLHNTRSLEEVFIKYTG